MAKRKLGNNYNATKIEKVQFIETSSGFGSTAQTFGDAKLKWLDKFIEISDKKTIQTKQVFMICDRDELPIGDIVGKFNVLVKKTQNRNNQISLRTKNSNEKGYLLSWKRREIENYLLSPTMIGIIGV